MKPMSDVKWTSDQMKAIEGRKGTLLVSAAAGSGKTAVLVERVIRRICDSENPCGVENLLIVTFTNAAAAQMKEKISAAIGKKIALNPDDKRLRRQQLMLPCANICTIDSFCINLVRENFHALGIAPDFGLLDEGKLSILRNKAVTAVAENLHEKGEPQFKNLCELISDTRDDRKLIDAILKLHSLSQAYPFPEIWLNSLKAEFLNPKDIKESPWGRIILSYISDMAENCIGGIDYCLSVIAEEPELDSAYRAFLCDEKSMFEKFGEKLENASWDEITEAYSEIAFGRIPSTPRGYTSAAKTTVQSIRDEYKKQFKDIGKVLGISAAEHESDVERLAPVVTELISAVLEFAKEFKRLKDEENGADFSDTLHMALELLVEPDDSPEGYKKTPLALALSENYAEILVDEYQDVNKAQDMIFAALSKNENNLFVVGDVKQSIYRFRQAMPEIFLGRRDKLEEYADGNYPAKVTLGKNFRSRSGVTEIVNYIFAPIMSREAGGLDYDEKEYLEAAASYPEHKEADTEVYLFETPKTDYSAAQARFAADYIEKSIRDGVTFSDGGVQRPARYKDFCVLLRSVKNSSAEFIDEFTRRGIPFSCEASGGFLSTPEIMFMMSLLKVIDNPVDDIPLTAVMLSPVFGFTPDDLALMRAAEKKGSVYRCVVSAAENGNAKAAEFLERTKNMRRIASTVRAGELVRRLIEETGYSAIVGAMKDSEKRRANLNCFIDLANKYESTGQKGVSGFINYIDKVSESGDIASGESKSDAADAVRIMTIHKSKGLEFPVCFVAACEKTYGDYFNREDLVIAPESGVGIKVNDGAAKYDTLPGLAAKLETKKAEHSEELRVLYVALTRPKEKLVILASSSDWSKKLSSLAAKLRDGERVDPFSVVNFASYSDCILTPLLRHPDAHALRNKAAVDSKICIPCDTPLKTEIIDAFDEKEIIESDDFAALPNEETVAEIKERLAYVYPYNELNGVVAKRIASNLDSGEIKSEYFASRKPAFMSKDKLTPAQRGTATHRFMQFADYKKASESVADELERLRQGGMLTEAEASAVEQRSVSRFFESELAKRILSADKVYKEYKFSYAIPLCEMHPEIPPEKAEGETVLIEGVADCAFVENGELVIVDYKTDRVSDENELVVHYSEQLGIYRRCLAEVIGLPVKETLIYSFKLDRIVIV